MQTHAATRAQIRKLVGSVDDSVIARIQDTEATTDEIAAALDDLQGRSVKPHVPPSHRMAIVRAILEDAAGTSADEETGGKA